MSHNSYLTYSSTRAIYVKDIILVVISDLIRVIRLLVFALLRSCFQIFRYSRVQGACKVPLCRSRICIGVFSSHITICQYCILIRPHVQRIVAIILVFLLTLFDVSALDQPLAANPLANLI